MRSAKFTISLLIGLTGIILVSCSGPGEDANFTANYLWFDEPATDWNQALPVGNGRLGAMVFGGVDEERLQLNEESVWCFKDEYKNKPGAESLDRIRELLFAGEYKKGELLARQELLDERLPSGTRSYQTLGDLKIQYADPGKYTNYKRTLNLDSALVHIQYQKKGTIYKRQVFSSAVDNMILFLETASRDAAISCKISLTRPGEGEEVIIHENGIIMKQHVENGQGVRYETRLEVINTGGTINVEDDGLVIVNADKLELRLVAGTNFSGEDPAELCEKDEMKAKERSYEQILADHIVEYQGYFNRVSIRLGNSEPGTASFYDLPSNERLESAVNHIDPELAALYFQFGRYLLISSSRPGNLPANLQGIWNEHLIPPWNADYHININIQMNYWPAEVTNLSECHLPMLDFIGRLRENGRRTAMETYGCRGFTAHHTTDLGYFTTPFGSPKWGLWPMGAAWASTHIWEHYLFTEDIEFLEDDGYFVMRDAALFLSDYLTEHPETGKLVTGPSISPENMFVATSGDTAATCMGPAMDLQIVWHLFTSVIAASEVLDRDNGFRAILQSQLEQLAPVNIGEDGRILEWSEEGLRELNPGHRHMSHLYGLYPSNQYNWNETPEYMEAAAKVIEDRLEHGGGHTGWSRAWMINFFARLQDGEEALHHIQQLFAKSTHPNMFDNHPPFQIDGNFGGTAGIAEMLLQSHMNELSILPALPEAWAEGDVKGLCARGGFEVDISWKDGELTQLKVLSKLGNDLKIRYGDNTREQSTEAGQTYSFSRI
ncbi:MAG TPA: glycoside hydrolase family 95 protein [Bacteroides sp.]|nr:glycoside hydrolase family 95 protein [Bacteroides sp.]